jgi:hypothetical protein
MACSTLSFSRDITLMKLYVAGIALLSLGAAQLTAFDPASFSPRVDFAANSGQVGLAFGDLDGDGKSDAVAANYHSGNVSVYRNTSTNGLVNSASFATRVNFTVGVTPVLVRLVDLDGDGKLDIVCVNQGSSTLSLLRNTTTNGVIDGTSFATKVDLSTPGDPRWVTVGDMNGDGRPDLASASYGTGKFSLFQNDSTAGALNFATRVDITPASSTANLEAGDIDGDGHLDLVVTYATTPALGIYRNIHSTGALGADSFASPVNFPAGNGATVTLGDLDGDGKLDVTTPNQSDNTLSVLRNTSTLGEITTNSLAARVSFVTGGYPYSAVVSDLDADGKPDVAVADSGSHTVSVFRNVSSSGSFTTTSLLSRVAYIVGTGPRVIGAADIDGDGFIDLGTPNLSQSSFSVLRNMGTNSAPPDTNAPGDDFNLSREFSAINNPSGVWSYGWKGSSTGAFSLLTETGAASADNGVPVYAWVLAGVGQPAVYGNLSTGTGVGAGGQFVIPPGTVWVHPGPSHRAENFGAVRFTAPSNSNYEISAAVQSIYNGSLSDDNEFRVAVNNIETFARFLAPNVGTSYLAIVTLNAGETVDFLVGRGADGQEYGSALKLAATITPTTNAAIIITNPPVIPPTVHADFNLGRDFSATTNPAGAWAYGWKGSLGGTFTTNPIHFTASSDNGVAIPGWAANSSIGLPAHYCNTSESTAIIGGGQGILPPETFWMHPGADGQPENFGAVRFTAPSNFNYRIETRADSLYTGYLSGDTDYHVVVNGLEVFGQPLPARQGTGWTNILALSTGDTIDLALGRGADGISWGAGLKITAIITPTTNEAVIITNEPPADPPVVVHANFDAGRDFLSTVNPSGAWSYGWKEALDANFTLHPIFFGASSDNGVAVSGWAANHTFGLPALYCNTSANTAIIGGGQGILPPGTVWFHPGANGQPENFGALRFTAPSNANYRIETVAASLYSGGLSGDTDFHVVVNGIEIFGQGLPATMGTAYSNVVALSAGDTVDFAIGRGADGDGYGAGLKISAILTPTIETPVVITNPPPVSPVIISQPPLFLSASVGNAITLHVTASGSPPLYYQWLFNGAEILAATNASLILSNVQPEQSGTYRVIVSNSAGSVTNSGTGLNVNVAEGGTVIFANQSTNRVYDVGANSLVPAGGSLVAGLFYATNGGSFVQAGGTAPFILPGRFSGGMRFIPGTAAGQSVTLQVRVWDTIFGATYEEAVAGKRGVSPSFNVTLGGGIQLPATLNGMPEFALTLPGLAAAQVKSAPALPLTLRHLTRTANGWAFMLTGAAGATHAIETSTDLVQWKTAAYVVANESGVAEFLQQVTSGERCFYRAKLANP